MYRPSQKEKEYTDYDIWEGVVTDKSANIVLERPSRDVLILNKGEDILFVKYNSLNKSQRTFQKGDQLELRGLVVHQLFLQSSGSSSVEIISLFE